MSYILPGMTWDTATWESGPHRMDADLQMKNKIITYTDRILDSVMFQANNAVWQTLRTLICVYSRHQRCYLAISTVLYDCSVMPYGSLYSSVCMIIRSGSDNCSYANIYNLPGGKKDRNMQYLKRCVLSIAKLLWLVNMPTIYTPLVLRKVFFCLIACEHRVRIVQEQ